MVLKKQDFRHSFPEISFPIKEELGGKFFSFPILFFYNYFFTLFKKIFLNNFFQQFFCTILITLQNQVFCFCLLTVKFHIGFKRNTKLTSSKPPFKESHRVSFKPLS